MLHISQFTILYICYMKMKTLGNTRIVYDANSHLKKKMKKNLAVAFSIFSDFWSTWKKNYFLFLSFFVYLWCCPIRGHNSRFYFILVSLLIITQIVISVVLECVSVAHLHEHFRKQYIKVCEGWQFVSCKCTFWYAFRNLILQIWTFDVLLFARKWLFFLAWHALFLYWWTRMTLKDLRCHLLAIICSCYWMQTWERIL